MNEWDLLSAALALVATLAIGTLRLSWKRARRATSARRWAWIGAVSLSLVLAHLAGLMAIATIWYCHRPQPAPMAVRLFEGIEYIREIRQSPRPLVIHLVKIDLKADGIRFLVTPPDPSSSRMLRARKTTDFVDEFGVKLAINANYFFPFVANGPWDYYPKSGEPVDVCGIAASKGVVYAPKRWKDGTVYLSKDNEVQFDERTGPVENALAGNGLLLRHGKTLGPFSETDLNSRAVLAVDRGARQLMLIVVDGKQPRYSEGVTLDELVSILRDFECHDAVRLDEGGSATLAAMGPDGHAILLNSPINSRIPGYERPVANHLGIFAKP